jgi:predicted RNA-binding protein with PIN domain
MDAESHNDSVLIVDGNNLIHRDPEQRRQASSGFEQARHRLVRRVESLADVYERIVVVFDGRGEAVQSESPLPNVEVLFSPGHLTADSVIERMVYNAPDRERLLVVTSDRPERDAVEAVGAASMSCASFLELLERHEREVNTRIGRTAKGALGARLGDFFP